MTEAPIPNQFISLQPASPQELRVTSPAEATAISRTVPTEVFDAPSAIETKRRELDILSADESRYKLLIFDFHGTLTDHQMRMIRALHTPGHTVLNTHLPKEFYMEALSRPSTKNGSNEKRRNENRKDFVQRWMSTSHPLFGDTYLQSNEMIEKYNHEVDSEYDNIYVLIPGMKPLLRGLIDKGYNIALLTNGTNRPQILETLSAWGFPELGKRLYSSHVIPHHPNEKKVVKPNPEAVHFIRGEYQREGLDIDPSEILMVGDYIDDMKTANNVGMDSALIVRTSGMDDFYVKDPKPTFVITKPYEIADIVSGRQDRVQQDVISVPSTIIWREKGDRKGPSAKATPNPVV